MGYQEKRVWVLFGAEFALYGVYFWMLHHARIHLFGTLHVVLAMIVAQIVLQALLAATSNPERRDERDRVVESRAYRIGYFVLLGGLAVMIAALAHRIGFSGTPGVASLINTLLFAAAVAELSKLGTQMVLYRRAA